MVVLFVICCKCCLSRKIKERNTSDVNDNDCILYDGCDGRDSDDNSSEIDSDETPIPSLFN
eukprot:UN13062